jgi:hypothetical protein
MDTTVGLDDLVVQLDLDLVFLAQRGRRAAITSGPDVQGA